MNLALMGGGGHVVITVEGALHARRLRYHCIHCKARVIPHAQSKTGARAHFEHYRLTKECKT